MKHSKLDIPSFIEKTHSSAPTPGGGGVSALLGSLGVSLAGMVANLTTGKKKYAIYEEDIKEIIKKSDILKDKLLLLIDEDAKNFSLLMEAYSLKKDSSEDIKLRNEKIQEGLKLSAKAPIEILDLIKEGINFHYELMEKGSVMVLSDVAVGVLSLKAGLKSAYVNIMINLNSIEDKSYVEKIKLPLEEDIINFSKRCDEIYSKALEKINIKEL